MGYEPEPLDIGFGIIAVAAVPPDRRWNQAQLLIMADHPLRDPARLGCVADVHGVTRLRRSALVTTLTDDKAIAAAAMIGDSNIPKKG